MSSAQIVAVIDDDSVVRSAVSFLLRSFGYLATTFQSAEDFLNSDTLRHTSCVITDVRMPGMGGVELQQSLVSGGYLFPIIFLTAFSDESVRMRVLSAGAHGFLSKPCEPQSLINCLESALRT
jgi:FixJ family two-component response regulator